MFSEQELLERLAERKKWYEGIAEPAIPSSNPTVTEVVETLKRDGVCVIKNFMPHQAAVDLGKRFNQIIDDHLSGTNQLETKVHNFPKPEICRILHADKLHKDAGVFFNSPFILEVAKAYTCGNIVSWQRMAERRNAKIVHGPSDAYHVDEAFYFKFKAFLYLSDVTETTAPFDYYKGSHRDSIWRTPKELNMLRYELEGEDSVFGFRGNFFEDREIDYLERKHGIERLICEGKAGTLILTDTRGIHKATTPVTGGRTMLGHYFELPRNR